MTDDWIFLHYHPYFPLILCTSKLKMFLPCWLCLEILTVCYFDKSPFWTVYSLRWQNNELPLYWVGPRHGHSSYLMPKYIYIYKLLRQIKRFRSIYQMKLYPGAQAQVGKAECFLERILHKTCGKSDQWTRETSERPTVWCPRWAIILIVFW